MPTALDDVALNKAAIIERCIRRIREEYTADPTLSSHTHTHTHTDALALNIERACQAAIDLAMHLVAEGRLGMPKNSGDVFTLIRKAGIIPLEVEKHLRAMTGFRNVAIHEYRELDKAILHVIVRDGWKDLVQFLKALGPRIEP